MEVTLIGGQSGEHKNKVLISDEALDPRQAGFPYHCLETINQRLKTIIGHWTGIGIHFFQELKFKAVSEQWCGGQKCEK